MATFNVEINLGNAAFEDSAEVARILRNLAGRVEVQVIIEPEQEQGQVTNNGAQGLTAGTWIVRDSNGSTVGSAWIEED